MKAEKAETSVFTGVFAFQDNPVNTYSAVIRVSPDAFHTVVTDLFRIQITAVAFTAPNAYTVIQNTLSLFSHIPEHLPFNGLYIAFERTVKLGQNRVKNFYRRGIPCIFQAVSAGSDDGSLPFYL